MIVVADEPWHNYHSFDFCHRGDIKEQNCCAGCGQVVICDEHSSDLVVSHCEAEEFCSMNYIERLYHMDKDCIRRRHPYLRWYHVEKNEGFSYSNEDNRRIEEFTRSLMDSPEPLCFVSSLTATSTLPGSLYPKLT